jgi:hypothetical protein
MTKKAMRPGVMCPLHSPKMMPISERPNAIGKA